jgi:N-glycosylase/DNA lyase
MNYIKREYKKREKEIKTALENFKNIEENNIFYELCYCLLTPGSKAKNADEIIKELKEKDFLNKDLELDLRKVRFHNTKEKRLREAKQNFSLILNNIKDKEGTDAREFLVENVNGFSMKEASHFLRNIGYRNLAILDRHILKNLKKFHVIEKIPDTITKKRYLEIENKFRNFSEELGINMDELDLLFWCFETGCVFK